MPKQRNLNRTVDAFVDMYDESLEAVGAPRLTEDQRDVLRGMLTALAAQSKPSWAGRVLRRVQALLAKPSPRPQQAAIRGITAGETPR